MDVPPGPHSGARFTIAPSDGVSRVALTTLGLSVLLVVSYLERGDPVPWATVLLTIGVGAIPLLAFLAMGRPSGVRVLEVLDDRLHLPFGPRSEQTIVVRYPELTTVYRRRGRRGYLLLATPYAQVRFARSSFASSEALERAYGAIRGRLESFVPNGTLSLERMDGANAAADAVHGARPIVTYGVVGTIVALYLAMRLGGGFERMYTIVGWGIGVAPLIEAGQFARVATASWLHGNVLHLAAVVFVILQFGERVERLFGSIDTLAIVGVAGLAGGIASALSATTPLFLGAQTIGFGLFGAYAFTATRYKADLPIGMRRRLTWWAFVGFLLAALPLLSGAIDLPGELGGLLVGVVFCALVLVKDEPPLPHRRTSIGGALLAIGGVAATVAGGALFVAQSEPASDETTMIRYHLDHSLGGRGTLNRIAWEIATEVDPTQERLDLARTAIDRALEREREDFPRAQFEDTYGQVLHRQGHRALAIEHELAALRLLDRPFFATQVARFAGGDGAVVLEGGRDREVRLELVEHEMRGFGVRVFAATATTASTLYAVARLDDRIVGLLRMSLDRTVDGSVTRWLAKEGAAASWPSGVTLAPAIYAPQEGGWRAWSADPTALALP